jgi:endonuclease YncB( thermonuclease family)
MEKAVGLKSYASLCAFVAILVFGVMRPSWAFGWTIIDGDTLKFGETTYRLDGIDAPEMDQACLDDQGVAWDCGIEARRRLAEFIGGRVVHCDDVGPDTAYPKRRIGICRVEGESATINKWIVQNGWALNFEPYARGRFRADETDARDNQRGIWKGCFAAPHDHRRWNKSTAMLLGPACARTDNKTTRDGLFPDHPQMPPGCSIKGNYARRAAITGHRGIYHMEGCRSYRQTLKPQRWFCSEDEANAAGFRKAFTC